MRNINHTIGHVAKSTIFLVLFTLAQINTSQSAEPIQWFCGDFPPGHIVTGDHANKGYADQIVKLLIDSLPEYEHTKRTGITTRRSHEIRTNSNVCSVTLIKTSDREEYTEFSNYAFIAFSNRLIVKKTASDNCKTSSPKTAAST